VLQQFNEKQTQAFNHAANAENRAKAIIDRTFKSEHQLLGRPLSAETDPPSANTERRQLKKNEADFLDRLARWTETIRPFSAAALGIAVAAVLTATLLRWLSGSTVADLRFGVYVAAVLATGLLAGVPVSIGAAGTSLFIVAFVFVPPYFAFKWLGTIDQISLALGAIASVVTIYFAHCCRVVLRRLHQRELANQILVNELQHRGRNMSSINEAILRKSLEDESQRAEKIVGRFRAVQNANNLLTTTTSRPITIRQLLGIEFAPYGENRFVARGPEVDVGPDAVRHLLLLFHELVTNAAKYGALSSSEGQVFVEWQWNGGRRLALTWTERGGPEVSTPSRKGFGSLLMISCLKSLNGNIDKSFGRDGFSCEITARIR
jgi:two-component sensor histidine kinase